METPQTLGKLLDASLTAVLETYNSGKIENSLYCIVGAFGTDRMMQTKHRLASLGY